MIRAAAILLLFPLAVMAQAVWAPDVTALAASPSDLMTAQAVSAPDPQTKPPTLAEVRSGMGIPSSGLEMRGQTDTVGYASNPAQMARLWELSATAPSPALGDAGAAPPPPGVVAVLAPHDDYMYAGRVYRQVLPLVTARTVILVGVFHRYKRMGVRDRMVFDPYKSWRAPDGPVPVSDLRAELLKRLPAGDYIQDAASHDSEHSLEAEVFWLRHIRPDVEIVPIIIPAATFERLNEMSDHLSAALSAVCHERGWKLGRDVAVVISADGVHYGADFQHTTFGEGGIETYRKAVERDLGIMKSFAGPISAERVRGLFATFVDPDQPDTYRLTWCGRFSIPFGMLLLSKLGPAMGQGAVNGYPIAYATSVGQPELPLRDVGMGTTAPANLYHFVGLPGAAFDVAR